MKIYLKKIKKENSKYCYGCYFLSRSCNTLKDFHRKSYDPRTPGEICKEEQVYFKEINSVY